MTDNGLTIFSNTVKPQRIILARESRGLSQGELASMIGVTQSKISKIESGFLEVSGEQINKIAQDLSYPLDFFYEFAEIYPLGANYYRKNKGVPTRLFRAIEASVNIRRSEFEKLLDSVEFEYERKLPFCDIDDDRYENSPEIIARSVRQYWKIPKGPISNLIELLESAGVLIVRSDFGTRGFSGVSTSTRDGVYIIFVNKNMPGCRLRFTIAHELGHIIMHKFTTEKMENEADRFASEFLMPSADIHHQLYDIKIDMLAQLKLYWKVSMAAILMKAKELETITQNQYEYLWKQMGRLGYKTSEPIEYSIPVENPTLVGEIVSTYLKEMGYTINQLAQKLRLKIDEFLSIYGLDRKNEPQQKMVLIVNRHSSAS